MMGIAMAIFLMALGGLASAICLYQMLPAILPIIGLGCGLYIFALGAVGFSVETGKIEMPNKKTAAPSQGDGG